MPGPVAVHSVVPVSTTAVVLAIPRENRRGCFVYNYSSQPLFIKFEADLTLSSFMLRVPGNWWYEMPWGNVYAGGIWGIWEGAQAPPAGAMITELVS
jgi:hypothetical protein